MGNHDGVNGPSDLSHMGEARPAESSAGQATEPDLHHVQPAGVSRGVVEVDVSLPGEPHIALGIASALVVDDDVDVVIGVLGNHVTHEVQELASAAPPG